MHSQALGVQKCIRHWDTERSGSSQSSCRGEDAQNSKHNKSGNNCLLEDTPEMLQKFATERSARARTIRDWAGLWIWKTFFAERYQGFPGGSGGKECICNAGDQDSIPGSEDPLETREWLPTAVLLPGKFHGQRSLVGYSPWCHKESDMTERLTLALFSLGSEPPEGKRTDTLGTRVSLSDN